MKKRNLVTLLILLFSQTTRCVITSRCFTYDDCDEYSSQTFMYPRPAVQNLVVRQTGWHNIIHERAGKALFATQMTAMYQKSIDFPELPQYFLFGKNCCNTKNSLLVMGDNVDENQKKYRNVRAEWLGLNENFSGGLSINPKQKRLAFFIEGNQSLAQFFDSDFFKGYWIDILLPIVAVENNISLEQFDVHNAGTNANEPKDILEAFDQKAWHYGKMDGQRSRAALAEARITLGGTYLAENNFQLSYYSFLTFAAAKKDPAHYLFDTVIGNNGHHGMGAGGNFQIVLNRDNYDYDICFFLDLEHTFLFRSRQCRIFDLKGKPWSRYLQFNHKDRGPDLLEPGVNVLTLSMRVHPYSSADFATGFRIKRGSFELEIGYNLWGHGDERLEFYPCEGIKEGYGIAGSLGETTPKTASASTIDTLADNDASFTEITENDINFCSGIARSAINHRAYIALSSSSSGRKVDGMFCAGVFFEFPQLNSALKTWGLWGKVGAAF